MKKRSAVCFALGTLLLAVPIWAQGPRGIPRTPDGKPDLNGVWQVLNAAAWDLEDHNASLRVPAGQSVVEGGVIPYQAAALAKKKENFQQKERGPKGPIPTKFTGRMYDLDEVDAPEDTAVDDVPEFMKPDPVEKDEDAPEVVTPDTPKNEDDEE